MTAREKFSKGRRVKLSKEGLRRFETNRKMGEHTRGTVVGYGRHPAIVKVQRDDIHTIQSFHLSWLEPAPEQLPLMTVTPPTENPE